MPDTPDFTPRVGQNIFRDVCTDPITGQPHKVKVCGKWLQFDSDPPIELPEAGMHVRLAVRSGYKRALVRGHDSDHLYQINLSQLIPLIDYGQVQGDYAAAFDADGDVERQVLGVPPYAAEGIHHIEPDGRWVMNNDPALTEVIDGLTVLSVHRAGQYTTGKCDAVTNSGVVRFGPDGVKHYPQYTQFPPFVNAQGWVAIQGSQWQMTPEPDEVAWQDAPAPMPVPVPPPVPIPVPEPTPEAPPAPPVTPPPTIPLPPEHDGPTEPAPPIGPPTPSQPPPDDDEDDVLEQVAKRIAESPEARALAVRLLKRLFRRLAR